MNKRTLHDVVAKKDLSVLFFSVLILSAEEELKEIIINPRLSDVKRFAAIPERNTPAIKDACDWFAGYEKSLRKEYPKLTLSDCSEFEKKIYDTLVKKVAFGSTVSYGELARLSGYPGAARAVGSAMRKNRFPLIIPCHRVIRASGHPGRYAGGDNLKKQLLAFEADMKNR
jgi:O-6-methylguanine DNA methyltransferase